MSDQRPTYRIPAGDAVPGMILCACEYRWPVTATGLQSDRSPWLEVDRGDYVPRRYGFRVDETVEVQNPGPSPRDLACTCKPGMGRGPGSARDAMCAAFDESPGPETVAADMLRPWRCAPPGEHLAACPVAPARGRHGGMRLWPAPWRVEPWSYCHRFDTLGVGDIVVTPDEIVAVGRDCSNARDEVVLHSFYLELPPPPENREPTPWAPHAGYEGLAVKYG